MRRTRLSLRSPKAIRKVALLQHINTSFPSFQMMHSTSSEQACHFFGLGLYFSLIYPSGTWGQGCTGRYLYWCFLINLTFHSQFLWHVLNPNQSQSDVLKGREEGRDRGEEKDREGKSVWKVQGLLYFDFPDGRTDSSYGSIIGYGFLIRGASG